MQKHTPYDTGKVKIGLLYSPPPPPHTPENDWIQGVLLGDERGISEEAAAALGSLVAIGLITLVMLLLGGI